MDEKARDAEADEKTHDSFEAELSRQKEADPPAGSPIGREPSPDAKLIVAAIEKTAADIVEAISNRR